MNGLYPYMRTCLDHYTKHDLLLYLKLTCEFEFYGECRFGVRTMYVLIIIFFQIRVIYKVDKITFIQ